METTITNKDQALNSLGVFDRKAIKQLSGCLEFVRVAKGRILATEGNFLPTSLVVVAGSVMVSTGSDDAITLDAPCVLDTWATDERRIARLGASTTEPTTLLLIDWMHRDAVFEAIERLDAISATTRNTALMPRQASRTARVKAQIG